MKDDVYDLFGGSVSEEFGVGLHSSLTNRSMELATVVYVTTMSKCGTLDILKHLDLSLITIYILI